MVLKISEERYDFETQCGTTVKKYSRC